ncbi:hypothetical protein C8Q73DRAFT_166288 [Cubamyces lactineus]|nr:hypothetical protein C8Q73DRAFT_166288 [Cubamyces lactineus]
MEESCKVGSDSSSRGRSSSITSGPAQQCHGLDVLPPELVDFIFAYTSYDKATISACALVSRSWRSLCIPHLFSSLTIVRQPDLASFERFLDAKEHVASYVRELELRQLESPHAAVACSVLAALCAKLPGLQLLRLRRLWLLGPTFHPLSPNSTYSIVLHRKLKELVVDDCSSGIGGLLSSWTLYNILQTFPADTLSLSHLTTADEDQQSLAPSDSTFGTAIQGTRVRVAALSLHHVSATIPPLFDVLRHIFVPQRLRTFRARWIDADGGNLDSLRSLGEFLREVGGAQLRHLEFPITIGPIVVALEDKPDHWRALQLHTCCNLESITIRLHVPPLRSLAIARRRPDQPIRQLLPLSSVLCAFIPHLSSSLRKYTLVLLESHPPRSDLRSRKKMDLERLDSALSEHLPGLTKFQVVVCDSSLLEEYSTAILEVMPKCRQRGILEIFAYNDRRAAGILLEDATLPHA